MINEQQSTFACAMKCYVGNLVHAEKLGELEVIERGALVVNADGECDHARCVLGSQHGLEA